LISFQSITLYSSSL